MRVAVLSLTRDRLDYSKHCFGTLRELAGCDFDHYVLDQGSTDGTDMWLAHEYGRDLDPLPRVAIFDENLGIHRGMNYLLHLVERDGPYDVVVKVDNDCELTEAGTLVAVAECALIRPRAMIGPTVQGLRGPVPQGEVEYVPPYQHLHTDWPLYRVARTPMIGGIMQPIPPGWRYDETQPPWGGDDNALSAQADWCGQLLDYPVNHYRTTDGQHEDYPDYFAARVAAGGPA